MLKNDELSDLAINLKNGRFNVLKEGPDCEGINLNRASKNMLNAIRSSDFLVVDGQSIADGMNGVKKIMYWQGCVSHPTSQTTTGLPIGAMHFTRIESENRTFDNFPASIYRRMRTSAYEMIPAARRTLVDYVRTMRPTISQDSIQSDGF